MVIDNKQEKLSGPDDDHSNRYSDNPGFANKTNPRSNLTYKKYKKLVSLRRDKVKELLVKGHSQQEIVSILHMSQPTVSRDIAFLHNRFEKASVNIGKLAFEQLFNAIEANNELLRRGWDLLDSSKKDKKLQLKVMNFISGCYEKRSEYIQAGPVMLYLSLKTKEYMKMEKYLKDRGIVIGSDYDDNTVSSLSGEKTIADAAMEKRREEERVF